MLFYSQNANLVFVSSRAGQARVANRHGIKVLQQRVTECLQKLQRHKVSEDNSCMVAAFSLRL